MSAGRVALSGYYGFANAGDEAVLAGLLLALGERAAPNRSLRINVLSIDPAASRRDHAVESAHRYRARALIDSIARCDLLASGGGSLLQDVTSRHSIFYYLGVVRAAQLLGKRTMFIAQGIGPLRFPRSRRLTAAVARRCDAITVRDQASADLLRLIGVERPSITVTADPALLLAYRASASGRNGIAFSVRSWPDAPDGFAAMIANACLTVAGGASLKSMQMSPDDGESHRECLRAFAASPATNVDDSGIAIDARPLMWNEAGAVAAGAELVIGMRLHALILAAANGIPALALAYDPKVRAFMEQTGQGDAVVEVRECGSDALTDVLGRVWSTRALRAAALKAALPALRDAAYKNADVALSLL